MLKFNEILVLLNIQQRFGTLRSYESKNTFPALGRESKRKSFVGHSAQAVLCLMLCLNLAACSWLGIKPGLELTSAEQRDETLSQLSSWTAKGRIQRDKQRAGLRWAQTPEGFDIVLRGPFGFGGVRLVGNAERVTINDGKQQWESDAPARDLAQHLGWTAPLEALPYWLKGLPFPAQEAVLLRDEKQRVVSLTQYDWRLSYSDFALFNDIDLPQLIVLQRDDESIQIEIRKWRLSE